MEKFLPLNLNFGLTTDCWHVYKLAPLLSNEKYYSWYVERFIEIQMGIQLGNPIDDFWVQYYKLENFDIELIYGSVLSVDRIKIQKEEEILSTLISILNQDGYILLGCDLFYMQDSSCYQQLHAMHEYLLCGYNQAKEQFQVLLNNNDKWVTRTVAFSEIMEAYQSGLNIIHREFPGHYLRFHMPTTVIYLNPLYSKQPNLYKIMESLENHLIGGRSNIACNPLEKEQTMLIEWNGISIYDGFITHICKIMEDNHSFIMDKNILLGVKKIYENKKGLLFRLQYLHDQNLIILEDQLINQFQDLIVCWDKIFRLVGVYYYLQEEDIMKKIKNRIIQAEKLDIVATKGAIQVINEGLRKHYDLSI